MESTLVKALENISREFSLIIKLLEIQNEENEDFKKRLIKLEKIAI